VLYLTFTTSSAITDNTATLFTGLPEEAVYARFSLIQVTARDGINIRLEISNSSVKNAYTPEGGIPAGQYEGFAVYIAK